MADLYKSYAQEAKAHGRASSTTKKPAPRTTDVILGEPVAEDTTASITAEMRPGCEEHAKMWDAMVIAAPSGPQPYYVDLSLIRIKILHASRSP